MITNSGAEASAGQPLLSTTQFRGAQVGDIESSINLFRGEVSLPVTLIDLPGVNGLSVSITAQYGSNVRKRVEHWNQGAPTGLLGVGWSLPFDRVIVDGQESGNTQDNRYLLAWSAGVSTMYPTAATSSAVRYQLRDQPYWIIEYDLAVSRWVITREDGTRYFYGSAPGSTAPDGIQWGIRWSNWIGDTTVAGGEQYPVAWNLVRIENTFGDTIDFEYEASLIPIGRGPASYTRSSRIARIVDAFGQEIVFTYAAKSTGENQFPHVPPTAADRPAYQFQFPAKYLDEISVLNERGDRLGSVHFEYELRDVTGGGGPQQAYTKRYLRSVRYELGTGYRPPPLSFEYFDSSADVNAGALRSIAYPEGGVATFTYDTAQLASGNTTVDVASPGVGFVPRVWHGPDYTVITWYDDAAAELRFNVYSWAGLWSSWETVAFDSLALDSLEVHASADFFVVAYRELSSGAFKLRCFHKDVYRPGEWTEHEIQLGSQYRDLRLAVGRDFVAATRPTATSLIVERWNGLTKVWERATLPIPVNSEIAIAAGGGACLVGSYVTGRLTAQLLYRDSGRSWRAGRSRTANVSIDWALSDADSFWSMAPSFAAAAFATGTSGGGTTLDTGLLRVEWDENFDVSDLVMTPGSQGASIENPILTCSTTTSFLGNAQNLYRFNGQSWDYQEALTPEAGTQFGYAYGRDIVLVTQDKSGRQDFSSFVYDPYHLAWNRGPINGVARATVPATPTVNGDYATAATDVYYRGADDAWTQVHRIASTAELHTVRNHAPAYVAYQLSGGTDTQVEFFRDGRPHGSPTTLSGERTWPGADGPGLELTGPTSFVTFSSPDFDQARTLRLYRVVDASIVPKQSVASVVRVQIDTGFETNETRFRYDTDSARLDASGEVAQFVRAWTDFGTPERSEGWTESIFFNGLNPDVPGVVYPDDSACSNARRYFGVLSGRLYQTHSYDADGQRVASQSDLYWVSEEDLGQNLFGFFVRLTRQVQETDLIVDEGDAEPLRATEGDFGTRCSRWLRELGLLDAPEIYWTRESALVTRVMDIRSGRRFAVKSTDSGPVLFATVRQTTDNEYNERGQLRRSARSNVNDRGKVEHLVKETRYGWEVYPGMLAANLLTPAVEKVDAWESEGERRVTAVTVVTFTDQWPGTPRWSANKQFAWDGSPDTRDFDFSAWSGSVDPPRGWVKRREITEISRRGLTREQIDVLGLTTSTLYDASDRFVVAEIANASLKGEEASYFGFEAYERSGPWTLVPPASGPSAEIEVGEAFAGTRRLALPGNSSRTGIRASFRPAVGDQDFVLSCWVKSDRPPGGGPVCAWKVTVNGSETRTVPVAVDEGRWSFFHHVLSLSDWKIPEFGSITVELTNPTPDTVVIVDQLAFAPVVGAVGVRVVEERFHLTTATLNNVGNARFVSYGRLLQPVAEGNESGTPTELGSEWLSRDASPVFDPALPNLELQIAPRESGMYEAFQHGSEWSARWATTGDWDLDDRRLTYVGEGEGTFVPGGDWDGRSVACRLGIDLLQAVDAPIGIRVGEDVEIRWEAGSWRLIDLSTGSTLDVSADPRMVSTEWLLLVTGKGLLFYLDGEPIFSWIFGRNIAGAPTFFTSNRVALRSAILGPDPIVRAFFSDGAGRVVQTQRLAETAVLTSATLHDDMSRPAVKTKTVRSRDALIGYRPEFVRSFDWSSGVMTGEIAEAYPDDGGYPYARSRFERSALSRVIEVGQPGEAFAILPDADASHTARTSYRTNRALPFAADLPVGKYLVARATDPDGRVSVSLSDRSGLPILAVKGEGSNVSVVRNRYDAAGNLVEVLLPNSYDTGIERPEDFRVVMTYDFLGRVRSRLEPNATRPWLYLYDRSGRIRFVSDPSAAAEGYVLYWSYDRIGRLVEQGVCNTPWDEHLLAEHVDERNWLPADGVWQRRYRYDGDGTVLDRLGHLVEVEVSQDPSRPAPILLDRFEYDANGRVRERTLRMLGPGAEREYATAYAHDNVGNVCQITYDGPFGDPLKVRYGFDALGDMRSVYATLGDDESAVASATYSYSPDGQIIEESFGLDADPDVRTAFEYNPPGWLSSAKSEYFEESLAYTSGGFRGAGYYGGLIAEVTTSFSPDVGSGSFARAFKYRMAYDELGRLVIAENTADPAWGIGVDAPLVYDPDGNRRALSEGGADVTYAYAPGTDQVVTMSTEPSRSWAYDASGRVVRASGRGISKIDHARFSGQDIRYTREGGDEIDFLYDANGIRVGRRSGGIRSTYVSSLEGETLQHVRESPTTSPEQQRFLYGPRGLFAVVSQRQATYVVKDHLGSTRLLVHDSLPVAAFNYRPFGSFLGDTWEPGGRRFAHLYTGQMLDEDLGLYDYKARFYDPSLGRFYCPDPAAQGPSPYVYVEDDPVDLEDPSGMFAWIPFLVAVGVGAAIGGAVGGGLNLATNWEGSTPNDRAKYFFVGFGLGAGVGASSAAVGFATAGLGIGAGVAAGAMSGAVEGALEGYLVNGLNNQVAGRSWSQGGVQAAALGGIAGAVFGGALGGLGARAGRGTGRGAVMRGRGKTSTRPKQSRRWTPPHTFKRTNRYSGREYVPGSSRYWEMKRYWAGNGGRNRANRTVLSGHGEWYPRDGYVRIPKGTTLSFYGKHGKVLKNSLGNEIELGTEAAARARRSTYRPGDTIENYTLTDPTGPTLRLKGNPITVTRERTLGELLREDLGDLDWAACRVVIK